MSKGTHAIIDLDSGQCYHRGGMWFAQRPVLDNGIYTELYREDYADGLADALSAETGRALVLKRKR